MESSASQFFEGMELNPEQTSRMKLDAAPGQMTCLGCGLFCDELTTHQINACPVGTAWLNHLQPRKERSARLNTIETDWTDAFSQAVEIFESSRNRLVIATGALSNRQAGDVVTFAQQSGSCLWAYGSRFSVSLARATARWGWSTSTLGEIADRADLIWTWNLNPDDQLPRLWNRLKAGDKPIVDLTAEFSRQDRVERAKGMIRKLTSIQRQLAGLEPRSEVDAFLKAIHPVILIGETISTDEDELIASLLVETLDSLRQQNRCFSLHFPGQGECPQVAEVLLSKMGLHEGVRFSNQFPPSPLVREEICEAMTHGDYDLIVVVGDGWQSPWDELLKQTNYTGALLVLSSGEVTLTHPQSIFLTTPGVCRFGFVRRCDGVPVRIRHDDSLDSNYFEGRGELLNEFLGRIKKPASIGGL